jgi:hypothetical protein
LGNISQKWRNFLFLKQEPKKYPLGITRVNEKKKKNSSDLHQVRPRGEGIPEISALIHLVRPLFQECPYLWALPYTKILPPCSHRSHLFKISKSPKTKLCPGWIFRPLLQVQIGIYCAFVKGRCMKVKTTCEDMTPRTDLWSLENQTLRLCRNLRHKEHQHF